MEFTCVITVRGSLVTYAVSREKEGVYVARLQSQTEPIPLDPEILLHCRDENWVSEPHNPLVSPSLIHALQGIG